MFGVVASSSDSESQIKHLCIRLGHVVVHRSTLAGFASTCRVAAHSHARSLFLKNCGAVQCCKVGICISGAGRCHEYGDFVDRIFSMCW